MSVSVMLTTKNRAADLRRTCRVLRQLRPAPLEVLITVDGCTDNTIEVVKEESPDGTIIVNEVGRGSVASRDRMMREASGELVFALDDDSYPQQLDCIARIVAFFADKPDVAVAHFPQQTDEYPETLGQTAFGPAHPTRSFANSGACLRRDVYLRLPGFESRFFHMFEEPDYAIQCVGAGYQVLFAPILTIRHHYSPTSRSSLRGHRQHARNEFWSTMMRCPFPQAVFLAIYRMFSQARFIARQQGLKGLVQEPAWWLQAVKGLPYFLRKRQPLPWSRYREWLSLP